jgi:hypothetical protein
VYRFLDTKQFKSSDSTLCFLDVVADVCVNVPFGAMSLQSNIEWTDATWNPVRGCTKVSAGCTHC